MLSRYALLYTFASSALPLVTGINPLGPGQGLLISLIVPSIISFISLKIYIITIRYATKIVIIVYAISATTRNSEINADI